MTNNLTTALQRISEGNFRDIALQSSDPFEALYRVNPEIATLAYAHKKDVLSLQILPYVARFRELQSDERISLIQGLVENYRTDAFRDVEKYRVDGDVKRVQTHEENETERTRGVHRGLTERTGMREIGKTKRKEIEMNGLFNLQKLEYESRVQMLRDHIEGQKYLSDNQLRAVHAEAEAFRGAIEARERIRADAHMSISRDRLEERVKVATIDFAKKIQQAEIRRGTLQDRNRANVITAYIQSQTQLCLDSFRMQTEVEIVNRKLEEKRVEVAGECYKSLQETAREGIGVIREAVSKGKDKSRFVIDVCGEKIVLEYESEE
jgi:hypothetical protein